MFNLLSEVLFNVLYVALAPLRIVIHGFKNSSDEDRLILLGYIILFSATLPGWMPL